MLLDLDEFKVINDSLGHGVGDRLLQIVGQRLRGLVRDTDTVARLGGDEFAIVMPGASEEFALQVAQRALDALETPVRMADRELQVRASIGLRFGLRGQSVEHLLRDADTAMYQAKSQGKGNVQIFEPSMHQASQDRLRVLSELSAAIDADQLVLYYQPLRSFADRSVVGAEALMRWNHPDQGLLPPSSFVQLAEESGLISALGDWALERAVRTLAGWLDRLPGTVPFVMHVNVSPAELRRPELAERVLGMLDRYRVVPARLALEIAETRPDDRRCAGSGNPARAPLGRRRRAHRRLRHRLLVDLLPPPAADRRRQTRPVADRRHRRPGGESALRAGGPSPGRLRRTCPPSSKGCSPQSRQPCSAGSARQSARASTSVCRWSPTSCSRSPSTVGAARSRHARSGRGSVEPDQPPVQPC